MQAGFDWRNGRWVDVTDTRADMYFTSRTPKVNRGHSYWAGAAPKGSDMKTHVTVDGVTLSRLQIENAMKALNTPEYPNIRIGDFVEVSGYAGIVVDKRLSDGDEDDHKYAGFASRALFRRAWALSKGWITFVTTEGTVIVESASHIGLVVRPALERRKRG